MVRVGIQRLLNKKPVKSIKPSVPKWADIKGARSTHGTYIYVGIQFVQGFVRCLAWLLSVSWWSAGRNLLLPCAMLLTRWQTGSAVWSESFRILWVFLRYPAWYSLSRMNFELCFVTSIMNPRTKGKDNVAKLYKVISLRSQIRT